MGIYVPPPSCYKDNGFFGSPFMCAFEKAIAMPAANNARHCAVFVLTEDRRGRWNIALSTSTHH